MTLTAADVGGVGSYIIFHNKILLNMKNLELDRYGAVELTFSEEKTVNGGSLIPWKTIGAVVVEFVIDQWDDIKKGWNDAASGKPYNYQK